MKNHFLFFFLLCSLLFAACAPEQRTYEYLEIGNQKWMSENLNNKTYADGSAINFFGEDGDKWEADTDGAYAWYNNDQEMGEIYGALYNWHAVNNPRNICPEGWRVPTDEDWKELESFLGMASGELDHTGMRQAGNIGGKLKDTRTGGEEHPYWMAPNEAASDEVGFTALAAGEKNPNGSYGNLGLNGTFWTLTEDGSNELRAIYRNLGARHGGIYRLSAPKNYGFSVRCIKVD